jgi:hypothetical protein
VLKACTEHDSEHDRVEHGFFEHDRIVIEMNEIRRDVSEGVQCGTPRVAAMMDEPGEAGTSDPLCKETTMLKTISAALIATSLIAAPALAANSTTTAGTANTTTQTQSQPTADTTTPAPKAAKVNSTKSKKLHTSARTIHHHTKKISLHKIHNKSSAKVASKVSIKPVMPATKRS